MADVLHLKNMVCPRCVMAVEHELDQLSIAYQSVKLGEVILDENLSRETMNQLEENLNKIGFELIVDKKTQLVENVKNLVIELIYEVKEFPNVNLSDYLSEKLQMDYSYISKQFSEGEGMTIERYVQLTKIERVKELISYNELSLSEIADQMHYSSVAHLSGQFKKVTGMTPSQYKVSAIDGRKPLSD